MTSSECHLAKLDTFNMCWGEWFAELNDIVGRIVMNLRKLTVGVQKGLCILAGSYLNRYRCQLLCTVIRI